MPTARSGCFYLASARIAEAEPFFTAVANYAKSDAGSLALADYYAVAKRPDDADASFTSLKRKRLCSREPKYGLPLLDGRGGPAAQAQDLLREVLGEAPRTARRCC